MQQTLGHSSTWEVIEHTLDLLHADVVEIVELKYQPHWALAVSKFSTKLLLAAALVETALLLFHQRLRLWLFHFLRSRSTGHLVVIGLGNHGRQLLHEALSDSGEPRRWVAGVDVFADAPGSGEALRGSTSVFIHGNAEDPTILSAAGVDRADRVVILAGTDDNNVRLAIAVARHAAERQGNPHILVGISSSTLLEGIREQLARVLPKPDAAGTGPTVRLINFRSVALRAILLEVAEQFVLKTKSHRAISVLVAAPPAFTADFLKLAIPFLQIFGAERPRIAICAPVEVEASFHRNHPEAERVADVRFLPVPAAEAGLALELEGMHFDVAIVAQEQTVNALHAAGLCLGSSWFHVDHVYAVLHQEPGLESIADSRMSVRSVFTLSRQGLEFGDRGLEEDAKANHEAYLAGLKPEARQGQPDWLTLDESRKESNRWAVLARRIKQTLWSRLAESERPAALEQLAIAEHNRWMAEKIMLGWRRGSNTEGKQDRERRLHPDICPWSELTEASRDKDRVQVREALQKS
jgi:Trk K+ transport system NAD-binding subunit